ncbi:hypothetical protein NESM_000007000 [Novymonas esmeraldas]|uniref:Uncharacterized protein n=1 Tax=Novymonas esmeraldas TaxID=1808958 RepID=A0AAW0F321_9TRYP
MSSDARKSRASVSRGGGASHAAPAPAPFFSEPPVPLPPLDALRSTDVLVRAYYASLVPQVAAPAAAATAAGSEAARSYLAPAAAAAAAAEVGTAGEVLCAAVAREVVEAAADLFASRSLDRLVGAYTACAAWDDMRDVVATSFLPQDHGEGASSPPRTACAAGAPPTPLFLRSALSLAGVATRTPSCTLTPQSCISPPPLSACRHGGDSGPSRLSCPTPPACVPMDAYCRYVLAVEGVPVTAHTLDTTPSALRGANVRRRVTRLAPRSSDKSAAESAVAPSLSPSPPPSGLPKGAKRGKRMGDKHVAASSADASLTPAGVRGGLESTTGAPAPAFDALTTAMRQAPPSLLGETSQSALHADRSVPRLPGPGGDPAAQTGVGEAEKRHVGRAPPRAGGVVLAVEQDRLWYAERARAAAPRGDRRKDAVSCRVAPPPDEVGAAAAAAAAATTAAAPGTEAGAAAEAAAKAAVTTEESPQQRGRRVTQRGMAGAAAANAKKELTRAREVWTSSFYTTADAAEEIPLQEQVQVCPSAGVTVVATTTAAAALPSARRSNKAAAGATVVASGGEFIVPADRMALAAFDDKRAAARKGNGGPVRAPQLHRDNARTARPVKAASWGPQLSEH